jgi:hypothetical protein
MSTAADAKSIDTEKSHFTLEARSTKDRVFGRVEIREVNEHQWGVYFFVGQRHAGFTGFLRALYPSVEDVIPTAIVMAERFAKQNGCRWVCVAGDDVRLKRIS